MDTFPFLKESPIGQNPWEVKGFSWPQASQTLLSSLACSASNFHPFCLLWEFSIQQSQEQAVQEQHGAEVRGWRRSAGKEPSKGIASPSPSLPPERGAVTAARSLLPQ